MLFCSFGNLLKIVKIVSNIYKSVDNYCLYNCLYLQITVNKYDHINDGKSWKKTIIFLNFVNVVKNVMFFYIKDQKWQIKTECPIREIK